MDDEIIYSSAAIIVLVDILKSFSSLRSQKDYIYMVTNNIHI